MVMGAWRISRARVLTRRASAIETLGQATVLCTDKTGTLTQNRMSILSLENDEGSLEVADDGSPAASYQQLVFTGALACSPEAYDPMDRAFQSLAQEWGKSLSGWELVRHYALQRDLLAVTYVWRPSGGGALRVAAKGAPEAIAELCHLGAESRAALQGRVDRMAESGMRVLAVAEGEAMGALPQSPREFSFRMLGLAGIADPVRDSVPAAIAECHAAGIRVVMITGDYPVTARAIARQSGLEEGGILDGPALEAMDEDELAEAVSRANVFARITPGQKLSIVQALQARGEVVGMTGDGVNDAPALKAANIGIAMGGRGTDVAREAASLVLLDDDFGSIVRTIRMGRRIYDNLRKAMAYIVAVHIPIGGLALLPLLTGLPLIFGPVHIAFMEMVIDPICSVVFEAESEESGVMRRPPRAADSPLLSRSLVVWGLVQGSIAFVPLGVLYWVALGRGLPESDARALTFVSLVLIDLGLVLVNRSFGALAINGIRRGNRALWWVSGVTLTLLSAVVLWTPARGLFRFGPLHAHDLTTIVLVVAAVVGALEILKRRWRTALTS
jgi:Ca2+-transporting ATPase